jgi:hypothetical protein
MIGMATFATMTAMIAETWNVSSSEALKVEPRLHPERREAVLITIIKGEEKRIFQAIIDPHTRKLGPFEEGQKAEIIGRMIP